MDKVSASSCVDAQVGLLRGKQQRCCCVSHVGHVSRVSRVSHVSHVSHVSRVSRVRRVRQNRSAA